MKRKLFLTAMLVVMVLTILPLTALAQGPECQDVATIQKDDWLSKLADKYFGDLFAWPAIMAVHNQAALTSPDKFANKIINADQIEVGWSVCIPTAAEADAFMAKWDPSKPEMLYASGDSGQ